MRRRIDPAIAWAFGCIVLVILVGSLYSSSFLSPEYLLQQLKVASFLGVIATGMMIVILLGQIDLSVPWVVAVGGMMATAATGWGPVGVALAIPVGIGCGVALGLVSGFGVGFLRIPSMVVTLAVNAVAQGLMVVHTGGFSPQDASSPAMRFIATGHSVLGLPNALLVWAGVGVAAVFLLNRTTFGRTVYAIGNRERAAYLSGARTRLVVMAAFAISGGLSAFGGVLLAGYASKAAQAMGDPYLLPAIAAVVLGGTSILGGRGSYSRHGGRRHPHYAAAIDPVGDADGGIRPSHHLRRRDHRDAVDLRPRQEAFRVDSRPHAFPEHAPCPSSSLPASKSSTRAFAGSRSLTCTWTSSIPAAAGPKARRGSRRDAISSGRTFRTIGCCGGTKRTARCRCSANRR